MFGMGGSEILVILIVALLFLGPEKLPDAASKIAKGVRDLRKQTRELTQTIENDTEIGGAIRDLKSALRGEDPKPRIQPRPAKKPEPKPKPAEEEEVAETAPEPAAEPVAIEPPKPSVKLPPNAGEYDGEPLAGDDEELAAMIKPAKGAVAKGADADEEKAG